MKRVLTALAAAAAISMSGAAMAKQKLCVFDIIGAQGDVFNMMRDFKLAAGKWGADIELKAYTDEKIAAEDFKTGQCDAVAITGMRGRQFNGFTGSLDSIGAIPSYSHMKKVIELLADPKMASRMVQGEYEVAGIVPMGAAYLLVNDRQINTVAKLAGKKIAILDYDKAQAKMVQKIGAQPVASDITNFAGKFNNGSVDVIASPAVAFKPLELYKGLGSKGAMVRYPVAQLTGQLILRKDKFPEGFGQKAREFTLTQADRAFTLISQAETEIQKNFWMDIPANDKSGYDEMMRQSRIGLMNDGIYDKTMMKFLKNIRCKAFKSDAGECSPTDKSEG